MIQTIIVAVIVLVAALYVIKRYAPKWLVRKLGAWTSTGMDAVGLVSISNRIAQTWTVESPTGKSCGSGCGRCGGCGNSDAAQPDPAGQEHRFPQKYPVIAISHKN